MCTTNTNTNKREMPHGAGQADCGYILLAAISLYVVVINSNFTPSWTAMADYIIILGSIELLGSPQISVDSLYHLSYLEKPSTKYFDPFAKVHSEITFCNRSAYLLLLQKL